MQFRAFSLIFSEKLSHCASIAISKISAPQFVLYVGVSEKLLNAKRIITKHKVLIE